LFFLPVNGTRGIPWAFYRFQRKIAYTYKKIREDSTIRGGWKMVIAQSLLLDLSQCPEDTESIRKRQNAINIGSDDVFAKGRHLKWINFIYL
jgi:hypothetical protein